ncbi:hypothetical protein GGH13_009323, partial [Coemansia sp. S155-1]
MVHLQNVLCAHVQSGTRCRAQLAKGVNADSKINLCRGRFGNGWQQASSVPNWATHTCYPPPRLVIIAARG